MTKSQQAILFINFFSFGLMIPVFNLILLAKGASLQTLPLLLAVYSITVLCMELPSGIFADLFGRKAAFLLSCGFQFVCCILLIAANHIAVLILAVIFLGLSRAFSSGSLDALFIDDALSRQGAACLTKVTSNLSIIEGVALALGGIAGGIITSISGTYLTVLFIRLAFTVMVFILCMVVVHELRTPGTIQKQSLIGHIRDGKKVVFHSQKFAVLITGVFFIGFFLSSVETYWQSAFINITSLQNSAWLLGVITFLGFLAVVAGNKAAQKIMDKHSDKWWSIYIIFRIIFAVSIISFAFQKNDLGFTLGYSFVYLLLGSCNIVENTLINQMTPNYLRASVLSLNSLFSQIGGLSASILSSLLIYKLQIAGIWMVSGGLLGIYAVFVLIRS